MGLMANLNNQNDIQRIDPIPEPPMAPDIGKLAKTLYSFYSSFMDSGFNENQAFDLTAIMFQGITDIMLRGNNDER